MNGRLLLDTNAVVSFLAGDPAAVARVTEATNGIPAIVVGELYYGAYQSQRTQSNITAIEDLLMVCAVLKCDAQTGRTFGQIKADLRRLGKPIPDNDIWIAATALQNSMTLLTRDAHFQHVAGLQTATW